MKLRPQINLRELPKEEKLIVFNTMFFGLMFGLFIGFFVSILVIQFAIQQGSKYLSCVPL